MERLFTAAATVLGALMGPAEVVSRQKFLHLQSWAPVLEQHAYKSAAAMAASLDLMRPQLVSGHDDQRPLQTALLNEYWRRAHVMAQLSLLVADGEAATWLAGMADQFAWINWTPTFPLLRERTIWLAACAAKSAAAFGEAVVSKYLVRLQRTRYPFKAFDALFGLTAIALTSSDGALRSRPELRHLRNSVHSLTVSGVEYMTLALRRCHWSDPRRHVPETAAAGRPHPWMEEQSPLGLATEQALVWLIRRPSQKRPYLRFVALPTILATPEEQFNPDQSRLLAHHIVKSRCCAHRAPVLGGRMRAVQRRLIREWRIQ